MSATYTRKFNAGRQSEQLLNEALYKIYGAIEHINAVPGESLEPGDAKEDWALWVDRSTNELKAYHESDRHWHPLFEGKYQSISDLISSQAPASPVVGQLWLCEGVLFYYDGMSWQPVQALRNTDPQILLAAFGNFCLLSPLGRAGATVIDNDVLKEYVETLKKLCENYERQYGVTAPLEIPDFSGVDVETRAQFAIPNSEIDRVFLDHSLDFGYDKDSRICVSFPVEYLGGSVPSAVHINPGHLSSIKKRLIRVDKENPVIQVAPENTEFYGFRKDDPNGDFLLPGVLGKKGDYEPLTDYIYLSLEAAEEYEYIAAITYSFNWYQANGTLTKTDNTVPVSTYYIEDFVSKMNPFVEGYAMDDLSMRQDTANKLITFEDNIGDLEISMLHTLSNEYGIVSALDEKGRAIVHLTKKFRSPLVFMDGEAMDANHLDREDDGEWIYVEGGKINMLWVVVDLYDWMHSYDMYMKSGTVFEKDFDGTPIIEYRFEDTECNEDIVLFADGMLVRKEDTVRSEIVRKYIRYAELKDGDPYRILKKSDVEKRSGKISVRDIHGDLMIPVSEEDATADLHVYQNRFLVPDTKVLPVDEHGLGALHAYEGQEYELVDDLADARTEGIVHRRSSYGDWIIHYPPVSPEGKIAVFIDGFLVDPRDIRRETVRMARILSDMFIPDSSCLLVEYPEGGLVEGTVVEKDASDEAIIRVDHVLSKEEIDDLLLLVDGTVVDNNTITSRLAEKRLLTADGISLGQEFEAVHEGSFYVTQGNLVASDVDGIPETVLREGIGKYMMFVDGILVQPSDIMQPIIYWTYVLSPILMKGHGYQLFKEKETEERIRIPMEIDASGTVGIPAEGTLESTSPSDLVVYRDEEMDPLSTTYSIAWTNDIRLTGTNILEGAKVQTLGHSSLSSMEGTITDTSVGGDAIIETPSGIPTKSRIAVFVNGDLVAPSGFVVTSGSTAGSGALEIPSASVGDNYAVYSSPSFYVAEAAPSLDPVSEKMKASLSVLGSFAGSVGKMLVFVDGKLLDSDDVEVDVTACEILFAGTGTNVVFVHLDGGFHASDEAEADDLGVKIEKVYDATSMGDPLTFSDGVLQSQDDLMILEIPRRMVVSPDFFLGHTYLAFDRNEIAARTKTIEHATMNSIGYLMEETGKYDMEKCCLLFEGKHVLFRDMIIIDDPIPWQKARIAHATDGQEFDIVEYDDTSVKTLEGEIGTDYCIGCPWTASEIAASHLFVDGVLVRRNQWTFNESTKKIHVLHSVPGERFFLIYLSSSTLTSGNVELDPGTKQIIATNPDVTYMGDFDTTLFFVDGVLSLKSFVTVQDPSTACIQAPAITIGGSYEILRRSECLTRTASPEESADGKLGIECEIPETEGYEFLLVTDGKKDEAYEIESLGLEDWIRIQGLNKEQEYVIFESEDLDIRAGHVLNSDDEGKAIFRYGAMGLSMSEVESGLLFIDGLQVNMDEFVFHDEDELKYAEIPGLRERQSFALVIGGRSSHDSIGGFRKKSLDGVFAVPEHKYAGTGIREGKSLFVDGVLVNALLCIVQKDDEHAIHSESKAFIEEADYVIVREDEVNSDGVAGFRDLDNEAVLPYNFLEIENEDLAVIYKDKLLEDGEYSIKSLVRPYVTTNHLSLGQDYILLRDRYSFLYDSSKIVKAMATGRISESLVYLNSKLLLNKSAIASRETEEQAAETAAHNEVKLFVSGAAGSEVEEYKAYDSYNERWIGGNFPGNAATVSESYDNVGRGIRIDLPVEEEDRVDIYAFKYASAVENPLYVFVIEDVEEESHFETEETYIAGIGALCVWINGVRQYEVSELADGSAFDLPEKVSGTVQYTIESPAAGYTYVSEREILGAENLREGAINVYHTKKTLYPGRITVYVNGLRQPISAYSVIDNYTLLINADEVLPGNAGEFPVGHVLSEGELHEIEWTNDAKVLVEVRPDLSRQEKEATLLPGTSYDISVDLYDIPEGILETEDEILFFLDGKFLGLRSGDTYNKDIYRRMLTILDSETASAIANDPLTVYLNSHPDRKLKWIEENGGEIPEPAKKKLLLEWR